MMVISMRRRNIIDSSFNGSLFYCSLSLDGKSVIHLYRVAIAAGDAFALLVLCLSLRYLMMCSSLPFWQLTVYSPPFPV